MAALPTADLAAQKLAAQALTCASDRAKRALRRLGFDQPEQALRTLDCLAADSCMVKPLPVPVLAAMATLPDPGKALAQLARFIDACGSRDALFARLTGDPGMTDGLVRVLAHGSFLTDILVRSPELVYWLFMDRSVLSRPPDRRALRRLLRRDTLGPGIHERLDALRRSQRRELLRIGAGAVLGTRDPVQIGRDLANLADGVVGVALEQVYQEQVQRYGRPRTEHGQPAQFCAVALGKHGGQELNFSSDIDLLFVYDEEGATAAPGGRKPVSNQEFYRRLGEQLVRTLTCSTREGFLYRVDMRLRPEGSSGPLVRSLRSYWAHYESCGEVWERQMLIKGRCAAGSVKLWQRFSRMLEAFVYPAHFFERPQDEIRRAKERIEARLQTRPAGDNNIKLQAGGIRDIEFIVQCLQLLNGRVNPRARTPSTLTAIRRLHQAGVLAAVEAQQLREAYIFFRRLENLLQIREGRPAYAVPASGAELALLAELMQTADGVDLWSRLDAHRGNVRRLFHELFSEQAPPADTWKWVLESEPGAEHAAVALRDLGFADGVAAHRDLVRLGGMGTMLSRTRDQFTEVAPELIAALAAVPDPDAGLRRLAGIVEAYGAPGVLFDLMRAYPGFRRLLVLVCGSSRFLAELVQRDPGLLDALATKAPEETGLPRPPEKDVEALRRYRNEWMLRIGIEDLLHLRDEHTTFLRLSTLAERTLDRVVAIVWGTQVAQHGIPRDGSGKPARFCCFAAGKLGGRELDFGSDLDLFFVYAGEGKTDGDQSSNTVFFSELAQEIVRLLQDAGLYRVDARLRPEGAGAPIATPLAGFQRYLPRRAATWERLALSRARGVAGNEVLIRQVGLSLTEFVYGRAVDERLIRELRDMRGRMEPRQRYGRSVQLDIKRAPGGIVDIEFIAQLLVLTHGHREPGFRVTGTRQALQLMSHKGRMGADTANTLLGAYERLRQVEKAMRIDGGQSEEVLPGGHALDILARAVGAQDGESLVAQLKDIMGGVRELFNRFFHIATRDSGN